MASSTPQPPALPDRIQLKENDAYGTNTSSETSLQPPVLLERFQLETNDAYETIALSVHPERIQLKENDAYGTDALSETGSLESNAAYGAVEATVED